MDMVFFTIMYLFTVCKHHSKVDQDIVITLWMTDSVLCSSLYYCVIFKKRLLINCLLFFGSDDDLLFHENNR